MELDELKVFETLMQLYEKQESIKVKVEIINIKTNEIESKYYDGKMHPIRKESKK